MSSAGVQSWTYTAVDNGTINGINIAENCPAANINNAIRQAMSSVMQELVYQGADISASVSMSLAGVDWRFMAVTGSASIIHVGTGRAGLVRNVVWNSPSTLVNSANILCDGAANIVAATNDMTMFTSLGSGAWRAVHFPVAGYSVPDGSITAAKLAVDAVETSKIATNAVTFAKMQAITDGRILGASGGTAIEEISIGSGLTLAANVLSSAGGKVVQQVHTVTGAYASGTDTGPGLTDTIPTTSDGTQFMSQAITPTNAANLLRVDVTFCGSVNTVSTGGYLAAWLTLDAETDARATASSVPSAADRPVTITFTYWMTAGSTSAMTFRVYASGRISAGTNVVTYFNGSGGGRVWGGTQPSGISITEYSV